MNARRFPGVRCSTLKTVCSSLLCLMIMPGRICVAGIAIKEKLLALLLKWALTRIPASLHWTPHGARQRHQYQQESGDHLKVDCSSCMRGTSAWPPLPLLAEDFGKEMADAMEEAP